MSNVVSGMLFSYFTAALALALPASFLLLFVYRRTMSRHMRRVAGHRAAEAILSSTAVEPPDGEPATSAGLRVRLSIVYGIAGAACAAVLSACTLGWQGSKIDPLKVVLVGYVHCWPLAPTLALVRGESRRAAVTMAAGYLLLGSMLVAAAALIAGKSPIDGLHRYLTLLKLVAAPPFIVALISCMRRLRAASPLVIAGLLMFSFGTLVLRNALFYAFDLPSTRSWILRVGMTPLFLIAALPIGYLCWRIVGWLGNRYRGKSFSDVQLLADFWWLVAVFDVCVTLSSDAGWKALWVLAAFLVYRGIAGVKLARWQVSSLRPPPARLLLLRVFGARRHAEGLFDDVARHWRFEGTVNLIAGADLAARTADPGQILAFTGGTLLSRFVYDGDDLQRRMAALDQARDPDGRYRVNDFLCFDDTWQPAFESLLRQSDVVLMDLRGFSRQNQGCVHELGKLAALDKLGRTLFVLDDASDEELLHSTLKLTAPGFPRLQVSRAGSKRDLAEVSSKLRALSR